MAWNFATGKACYDGDETVTTLTQNDAFEIGKYYYLNVTISNIEAGGLRLESIVGKPEFTEDGTYTVSGVAIQNNLEFTPYAILGDMFDGCVDDVESWIAPYYSIQDLAGNVVFQQVDNTGMTSHNGIIQYQVDWTNIPEGIYQIVFSDGIVEYESYCLCLKEDVCGTRLLSWTNDNDAYGFDYSELEFTPIVRVEGKLWKPTYPKNKEVFVDNSGSGEILASKARKKYLLSVDRQPEYIHDAISIGLENHHFKVDGLELVNEDDDYVPKWVNSANIASAEVELFVKRLDLNNSRCEGNLE